MTNPQYVEHQTHEVSGFRIVDATSTGSRPHDDLIWVGTAAGQDGKWISPESAMELVAAIAKTAHGNMERRRLAQISQSQPVEVDSKERVTVQMLEPLEPLPTDGYPITKLTILNPVGRFVSDPVFTMQWLQTITEIELSPKLVKLAKEMALAETEKGTKLTLMSVIELWRPVPELRDFAETLYVRALPSPFLPARTR